MKKEGSLKSILAILVIILICLVSLGGIYVKKNNVMKNILPEYVLGKDVNGSVIVKLDVSKENSSEDTQEEIKEETEETEEADVIENSEESLENVQEETEQKSEENSGNENVQAEDLFTEKNYKKSKEIIEKRLKIVGMENYEVRLDQGSGNMVIEVPADTELQTIGSAIQKGKTEIQITETKEVIGDKNSIASFKATVDDSYITSGYGSAVKIEIKFSKDAVKKFKEMKNNYVAPVDEEGVTVENNVSINIDGSSIVSVNEKEFLDSAANGSIQLYGQYSKDNTEVDNSVLNTNKIKMLIDTEDLPLTYSASFVSNKIQSNINKVGLISVFAVLLGVMLIYLVIRFKLQGIFGEISIIGLASLLLFVLRITKVEISIATIVGMASMLVLQFVYLTQILKSEKISSKKFNEKTATYTKMLIPVMIFSIVISIIPSFTKSMMIPFGNIQEIANFGMVGFWGLIIFELFNNILTRAMIVKGNKK